VDENGVIDDGKSKGDGTHPDEGRRGDQPDGTKQPSGAVIPPEGGGKMGSITPREYEAAHRDNRTCPTEFLRFSTTSGEGRKTDHAKTYGGDGAKSPTGTVPGIWQQDTYDVSRPNAHAAGNHGGGEGSKSMVPSPVPTTTRE
jgi:hypothetical protein